MADNYLEKKMEEHRSRMAAGVMKRVRQAAPSGGLVFAQQRIIVDGAASDWEAAVVMALRAAGHRVAFMNPAGSTLAQTSGARCYPLTSDRMPDAVVDLNKHWGGLDMIVRATLSGDILVEDLTDGSLFAVSAEGDAASAVVILTHPSVRLIHRSKPFDGE
ncbi:MAG: hypothetical protein HDS56_07870 [Barnesiella sp.]|nr:hypothetical protein [Barnesiella sp.]